MRGRARRWAKAVDGKIWADWRERLPRDVSHYRIDSELGRGGMGVIYRAYDQRLLRWVALKMVRDDIAANPVWRSRILEEARAACALSHPAITTIYEVGDGGDGLFIVMELVAGQTLRATLTGQRVDTRTLLSIGIQIAEALAAAHDCGVIHRDIKPENVMV